MDISKLPKLSHTPSPHNEPHRPSPEPTTTPFIVRSLFEAWISLTIGVLILLMNPTFLRYLYAMIRAEPFRPFVDPTLDYAATINFWSDLVITLFALLLLQHGVLLLLLPRLVRTLKPSHLRAVLIPVILFTAAVTTGNLLYLVWTYTTYGLALLSALAVIFGGLVVASQWAILQRMRLWTTDPAQQ